METTQLHPFAFEQASGIDSAKGSVMVVDDEDPVRELVAYVLESHGYNVYRARNSREALHIHAGLAGGIDLLFTDICMLPHDDGFALARSLRRERPGLRVIFASGFVEPERLRREVDGAGALFLPKPFTPSEIVSCVERSLISRARI